MEYNLNKTFRYRVTASLISLSIISSSILPIFSSQAQAQWVVTDPAHTAITAAKSKWSIIKDVLDTSARIAAQIAIQRLVASTVSWAQSGFEGNPAYVVNPKQYFADIADGVAGEFIEGSDLGFLCSPFQAQIRLALRQQYLRERQFQCTLTDVIDNIEAFYDNFDEGGWDAWFAMTQNSSNNPYGAFLDAQIELDNRVLANLNLEKEQLDWNQGFRNLSACDKNHPSYIGPRVVAGVNIPESCSPEAKTTQTPGSIIKSNLDKVLPAGLERLINVQQADQLIEAFAAGILRRYVFGPEGLFKRGTPSVETPTTPSSVYPPYNEPAQPTYDASVNGNTPPPEAL